MSCLSERHEKLVNGHAPCSVPMWSMGGPAGFCNDIAYGKQTPEYLRSFPLYDRYRQPAYCSAYACHAHGGPKEHEELLIYKDGDSWCAVKREGFTNIQECHAVFSDSPAKAIDLFYDEIRALKGKTE